MNFKEALIAHFSNQDVECHHNTWNYDHWKPFGTEFSQVCLQSLECSVWNNNYTFRIKPRTIRVNGVEVPAPESVAPEEGTGYYVSTVERENTYYLEATWDEHSLDRFWLNRGLVYLNKEDAIARAKAMLLTQE